MGLHFGGFIVWRCLLPRQISGRRVACPPASRPRRELRSARRLEARPGPADPAAASYRSGLLSVSCPPWPRHRPPAPRPGPAGPAGPAAASYRSGRVVCVLPGLVLCGIRGACAEHEEARDCCRQNERADAYVHKGAGCLSNEESLKQPGQQEETEEAPHASCCACHQLL